MKRARPDISTTFAFLVTRVKSPDEDDCKTNQSDPVRPWYSIVGNDDMRKLNNPT